MSHRPSVEDYWPCPVQQQSSNAYGAPNGGPMPAIQPRCEVIVDALQLACRAPSLHNSQPWRWVATDDTVELFADPARLVRSADTTGDTPCLPSSMKGTAGRK